MDSVHVTDERCEGDQWRWHGHGGRKQAICLYALECLEVLKSQGFQVFPEHWEKTLPRED